MHINVDGALPLAHAHQVAEQVREVVEELPEVELAFIHVEPASQLGEDTCTGAGNGVQ
jgi:divalent metal cation (Fe/Co/Zn/Cd) transporter